MAYWDPQLRNRLANRAYLDWYAPLRNGIRGEPMRQVVGEERFLEYRSELDRALSGQTRDFEQEVDGPQGRRSWVVSFVPEVSGGIVVGLFTFVSDVTALRQAQKAQLDASARLRGIIDGATEFSIVATDTRGTIELFSTGAERMLGYRGDELVGKASAETLHEVDELRQRTRDYLVERGRPLPGFEVLLEPTRRGQAQTLESIYVSKDGRRIPVQLLVTPLRDHLGEMDGFLLVARDITRDKDALRVMADAREQAERANQMKGEFVANTSHEIRTPMNAVLGMAQLLETTNLSPNQRRYLDMIQKAGKSLLSILDDILDFSKVEAGKLQLQTAEFRLDDVLDHVANVCAVAAQGKGLELSLAVDPDIPPRLVGDPMRLQQVLVNLVGNAVKFTQVGHVAIHVELLERSERKVEIGFRVEDSGIGMGDDQLRRIFHPFSQADGSITRRFGGTGLGLAISKRLAEMMGGTIGVQSKEGVGTIFYVSLPFLVDASSFGVTNTTYLRNAHLLVVDDDARLRQSLVWAGAQSGWKVTAVETLEAALGILREASGSTDFDAILIDARLPGWEDREGIQRIREACPLEIPVVKLSDFRSEGGMDREFLVLDGVLIKPVTPKALRRTVCDVLGHRSLVDQEEFATRELNSATRPPLDAVRILLVEDNAFNQVVASETLRSLGAIVDIAENGRIACDRLAEGVVFDIVIMDVQMPVMDGYTATRHIREQLGMDVPILAMTAGVTATDRDRCLASGMDDFLTKPFQIESLVRIVQDHLDPTEFDQRRSDFPADPSADSWSGPSSEIGSVSGQTEGVVEGVFEPERLIEMLGHGEGSEALVRSLVEQFLQLTPATLEKGLAGLRAGDLGEAIRAYHNLKSSSASLGALALSEAARGMEAELVERGAGYAEPTREAVGIEFARVESLARRWLEED